MAESMNADRKSVGARIRKARQALGLSQQDLAKQLRMSRQNLTDIELGATAITTERLVTLCDALGKPMEWLVYGRENGEAKGQDTPLPSPPPQGGRGLNMTGGGAGPTLSAGPTRVGQPQGVAPTGDGAMLWVSPGEIGPGYNPRRFVENEAFAELCESVRSQGVIEPLVVRLNGTPPPQPSPLQGEGEQGARVSKAGNGNGRKGKGPHPRPLSQGERGVDDSRGRLSHKRLVTDGGGEGQPRGVGQPQGVAPTGGAKFVLVCGERRWRAAVKEGVLAVPVIVREISEAQAVEIALVENEQREDIDVMAEAQGFEKLIALGKTETAIAEAIGKSQPYVANRIRLLKLPKPVQDLVQLGKLPPASALPLLSLPCPEPMVDLAKDSLTYKWSSRELQQRVKDAGEVMNPEDLKEKPFSAKCPDCPKKEAGTFWYRPNRWSDQGKKKCETYKCFDDGCRQKLHAQRAGQAKAALTRELKGKIETEVENLRASGHLAISVPEIGFAHHRLEEKDLEGGVGLPDTLPEPCESGRWWPVGDEAVGEGRPQGVGRPQGSGQPQGVAPTGGGGCRFCGVAVGLCLGNSSNDKPKIGRARYCAKPECYRGMDQKLYQEWLEGPEGQKVQAFAKEQGASLVNNLEDETCIYGMVECLGLPECAVEGHRTILVEMDWQGNFKCDTGKFYCAKGKKCAHRKQLTPEEQAAAKAARVQEGEQKLMVEIDQVRQGGYGDDLWAEMLQGLARRQAGNPQVMRLWLMDGLPVELKKRQKDPHKVLMGMRLTDREWMLKGYIESRVKAAPGDYARNMVMAIFVAAGKRV